MEIVDRSNRAIAIGFLQFQTLISHSLPFLLMNEIRLTFFSLHFLFGIHFPALRLGLPFVPSYLGQSGMVEDMVRGVNYASAGAGIIFSSGSELVAFNK